MKSIQNTTLTCGLLNAPVKIFSAAGKESEVNFSLCTPDGDPVEQIYVLKEEGPERQWNNDEKDLRRLVKVFEYAHLGRAYGDFPINHASLTNAEEASLTDENGNDLKSIIIESFVPLKDLPTERGTKLYYLGPDKKLSTKSFETFKVALKKKKVAAIAKVVVRSRQKLFAIYVKDDVVLAQVLDFYATMNARDDSELVSEANVKPVEVNMMGKLIDSMMDDASSIDAIEDTYVARKRELVEDLIEGKEVKKKVKTKKEKADDSLLDALKASVEKVTA